MFQLDIYISKKTLDLCLLREGAKGKVKSRKLKNDFNAASVTINWLHKQHSTSRVAWKQPGFKMLVILTPVGGLFGDCPKVFHALVTEDTQVITLCFYN